MIRNIISILLILITPIVQGQKLIAKNAHIRFYSHTPIEDIEAHNRQAVSILDPATGELQFKLLIKAFEFEKKLMQEHFNENYMESDKFPKASFTGKIINMSEIDLDADGKYPVIAEGELTIRGITQRINISGTLTVMNGKVSANSVFMVSPKDYAIDIPNLVRDNIAREIEVTVSVNYSSN